VSAKHFQGWICEPAVTGPPIGWLVIVIRDAAAPERAVTTFSPFFRPSSRAM
jgi:hypothetical protein